MNASGESFRSGIRRRGAAWSGFGVRPSSSAAAKCNDRVMVKSAVSSGPVALLCAETGTLRAGSTSGANFIQAKFQAMFPPKL